MQETSLLGTEQLTLYYLKRSQPFPVGRGVKRRIVNSLDFSSTFYSTGSNLNSLAFVQTFLDFSIVPGATGNYNSNFS